MQTRQVLLKRGETNGPTLRVTVFAPVGGSAAGEEAAKDQTGRDWGEIDEYVVHNKKSLASYLNEIFKARQERNRAVAFAANYDDFCELSENDPSAQSIHVDLAKLEVSDG